MSCDEDEEVLAAAEGTQRDPVALGPDGERTCYVTARAGFTREEYARIVARRDGEGIGTAELVRRALLAYCPPPPGTGYPWTRATPIRHRIQEVADQIDRAAERTRRATRFLDDADDTAHEGPAIEPEEF